MTRFVRGLTVATGLLALLALGPVPAGAAVFDIAGPAADQIDGVPVDVVLNTAQSGAITDLNIQFLVTGNSSTIFPEDWSVTLIHGATSVVLKPVVANRTVSAKTWSVTWDDEAAGPLTNATSFVDGTYTPSQPLSAFDGLSLSGSWTLRFNDTEAPGEHDALTSWRIFGTTANATGVPMPATLMLFAAAVAGLGAVRVWRRR